MDVFEDMEDAQLMLDLRPQGGQHGRIEIRSVGDNDVGVETMEVQLMQEAFHVFLIVGRDQREGDREIAERSGGQEQGLLAEVQFVDAQGAGEVGQGPGAVGGAVDLADLPVQAVVEETIGKVEVEIAVEGGVDLFHVHVVEEEAVEDRLADLIGVAGTGFDAVDLGPEGGTTVAGGVIFGGGQMDDDDGAIGNAADRSLMEAFAAAAASALGTRVSFGSMAPKAMDGFEAKAFLAILVLDLAMG